jgi:formiminotetrahydrofolate cyclodeaminase
MLSSDLAIAAILAEASSRAAYWNVRINTSQMTDDTQKTTLNERAETILNSCKEIAEFVESSCSV